MFSEENVCVELRFVLSSLGKRNDPFGVSKMSKHLLLLTQKGTSHSFNYLSLDEFFDVSSEPTAYIHYHFKSKV